MNYRNEGGKIHRNVLVSRKIRRNEIVKTNGPLIWAEDLLEILENTRGDF